MGILLSVILTASLIVYLYREKVSHTSKLYTVPLRIHVNGIRGKSSVTRLVTSVLWAGNIQTLGKTTGSDANVLWYDGSDIKIERKGPPNILENISIIRNYVTPDTGAIVFECMAIQPKYQRFLQERILESNISVITNIREDHQEEMGYTLEEIAESLALTIPTNGILISTEQNTSLQRILIKRCVQKNTRFINALEYLPDEEYVRDFPYFEHSENIAIGLAIADICGIPQNVALKGMLNTKPDKGITVIKQYEVLGKQLIWCNLFAANDRESVVLLVKKILSQFSHLDYDAACLLNNRADRPERAQQFADIVTRDLSFDFAVTIGDYEEQVSHQLKGAGQLNILKLARYSNMSGEELVEKIVSIAQKDTVILFGLANIHTPQAEHIMEYLQYGAVKVGGTVTNSNRNVPMRLSPRMAIG